MFACIYLYVRIYIYITHIYIHEYTHTGGLIEEDVTRTSLEKSVRLCICVCGCIYMGAYIYNKYSYAHIRTCRWADRLRDHAHVDGEVSAPIYTCVYIYVCVYVYVCIHAHIYI